MVMNMQAGEQKKGKIEAKLEDLMWKFNLMLFVLAVGLGCMLMYVAGRLK
jgi:hypothetical protein